MKPLQEVADDILAVIGPLPDGYRIEVHPNTNSIIVCTDTLGFCLTQGQIEDGLHLEHSKTSMVELKKLMAEGFTG